MKTFDRATKRAELVAAEHVDPRPASKIADYASAAKLAERPRGQRGRLWKERAGCRNRNLLGIR